MSVEISVDASAQPDSLEAQCSRAFDLSFTVNVSGSESLADLTDAEIYDLVFPLALKRVQAAMQSIADNTRSQLLRTIRSHETSYSLSGNSTNSFESGAFKQRHEIDGQMIVDANEPASTGESWLLGQEITAKGVAENIVCNVLKGLGRDTVKIENQINPKEWQRNIETGRLTP